MDRRLSDADVDYLAHYVATRTGIVFADYRRPELERALMQAAADAGVGSGPELVARFESGRSTWDGLLEQVTVGETYFFRDPEHFAFVRAEVLPVLHALRSPEHGLRIWSAGCASGEETYSLAILLQQHALLTRASVLGTDLTARAVTLARAGVYRAWSMRNCDDEALAPFFVRRGDTYTVCDDIRARVRFEQHNLAQPNYAAAVEGISGLDLIFCRNVFIYLDPQTSRSIADRFYEALAPGGFLILGPSDPLLTDRQFELITTPAGVFYRRPAAATVRGEAPRARHLRALEQGPLLAATAAPLPIATEQSSRTAPARAHRTAKAQAAPPSTGESERVAADIRSLINETGAAAAEGACRLALERAPLAVELHYLHGLLLSELGEQAGAIAAFRRTLYLDRELSIAHFALGVLLARTGDTRGAERAFRNAERTASQREPGDELHLSDGLTAAGVALAARRELGLMGRSSGVRS